MNLISSREDMSFMNSAEPSPRSFQGILYRALLQHMDSVEPSSERLGLIRTLPQLSFVLIQTLQIIGMILELTTETLSPVNLSGVLEALKVVRPDLWAEETQQIVAFLGVSIGLLMVSALWFLVELVLVYLKPERKRSLIILTCSQLCPILVQRVLFLPLLHFYLSVTRSSLFLSNPEAQYLGAWKGVLSLIGLVLVLCLVTFRVLFFYESAWYLRTSKLLARPNSDYETAELTRLTAMCCVFVYLRQYSVVFALVIVGAVGVNLFQYLVVTAPYYNSITLNVKRIEMTAVSWMCVCALVGITVSSFGAVLLLFVIITPCAIVIVWAKLKDWDCCANSKGFHDFFEFELVLRAELSQGTFQNEDRIEALWTYGLVNFHKVKQYYLFLSHYMYYSRGLVELALVRLSFSNKCAPSLIQDFQIYRFSESISQKSKSEERDYLNYVTHFNEATALDLSLCKTSHRLLQGLIHRSVTSTELKDQFSTLSSTIEKVKKSYSGLMSIASKDPFVLEHYGSLITDIFQDKAGISLMNQGKVERLRRAKLHINTIEEYSSQDMGVLVISCHPKSLGVISYANQPAATALNCAVTDIIGKALNDFLPPPFFIGHNEHLYNFLLHAEIQELLRKHLFLYTPGKYSIEVTFRFRITAMKNVAYFLVAFRKKPKQRHFAVFDHGYVITSHSRYFKDGIVVKKDLPHPLNGRSLETFFPGIVNKLTVYGFFTPILYTHPDSQESIGLFFMNTSLGHDTVTWVYFLNRNSEVDDLFSAVSPGQTNSLRRLISSAGFWSSASSQTVDLKQNSAIGSLEHIPDPQKSLQNLKDENTTGTTHCESSEKVRISLKKKIVFHARRSRIWLLLTLSVSVLILVNLLAINFTTLQTVFQDNVLSNLGLTRLHLAQVTFLCRKLDLIQQGSEPGESSEIALLLKDEIKLLQSRVNAQLTAEVTTWSLTYRKYEVLIERLNSALVDFLTHANLYADSQSFDLEDGDLYYVYTNGIGEFSHTFDSAVYQYIETRVSEARTAVLNLSIVLLILMCAGTCIGTALSVRHLFALSLCQRKCWDMIVNLRRTDLDILLRLFQYRMEHTHGKEEKLEQDSEFSFPKKLTILKMPRKDALLMCSFLFLLTGTAAFTVLLLGFETNQLKTILIRNGDLLNAVTIGSSLPTTVFTLLKEAFFEGVGVKSYHNIVGSADVIYSLKNIIEEKIAELAGIERRGFISGTSGSSGNSYFQDMLNLDFRDSCAFLSIENCSNSALSLGLYSSLSDFRMEASSLLEALPTVDFSHLLYLENTVSNLRESVLESIDLFQSYCKVSVETFWYSLLLYCGLYMIGCVGLNIGLYHPIINNLTRNCLANWRITTMIRSEFLEIEPKKQEFDW